MKTFEFTLLHDNGKIKIRTSARNLSAAIEIIRKSENCPDSAIMCWRVVPTQKQINKAKLDIASM